MNIVQPYPTKYYKSDSLRAQALVWRNDPL